uniref:Retrotransposon gag domain-containing protein n=1 Tax=Nicotiana tabacum TaxID=4097 RepID=A0A1S3YY54_TOBAC
MVTYWILNSLSKEIADSVEYANDAVELWRELEDRYEQTNGARLYQIQKEINDLSQGTLDITTFYTQLKKLWEELSTLNAKTQCSCQCTCGAKENMHKTKQDRRLIQFLMGLNEVYTAVRGGILMMNPLPSMAQAFSLLIQDEKQREMKPTNNLSAESVSLHVNTSGNANNFGNNNFRTNYAPNANFPNTNRTRPFCDYCKRLGHTKGKCFKLHGYPQGHNHNFKYNKNKRVIANAHVTSPDETCAKTDEFGPKDKSENLNLSKEQYGQLLSILQHFHGNSGGESSKRTNHGTGTVNLVAGPTPFADSGASHHMTFNRSSLLDITILPYPLLVTLPNGYKAPSMKRPLEI